MANINIIGYWNVPDNIPALPYIGVDGDTLVISIPGTRDIGEGYINYLQNRLVTFNSSTNLWKYDGDSTQVSIVTGPTGTLPEVGTTIPLELNYLGSVGLSAPYWYTVENSPLTTNGTIAVVPNQGLPPGKVLATPVIGVGPLDLRPLSFSDFPTSSVIPGEYINPTVTVNAQGIITSIFSDSGGGGLGLFIPWSHVTETPTTIAGYGITDPLVYTTGTYVDPSWITSLDYSKITGTATGVTAGSYTNANITVGADGRITAATSGASSPCLGQGIIEDGSGCLTLDLAATTLVPITITTTWTIYKNDGTTHYTPFTQTTNSLTAEVGCKVTLSATYIYPTAGSGQALPVSTSGAWGTSLPGAGVTSPVFTDSGTQLSSNTSFSQSISKPNSGLIANLSTGQVNFASGSSTNSASTSVIFAQPTYFGLVTTPSPTGVQVSSLTKTLRTSKSATFNEVTDSVGHWVAYSYPASLGAISTITSSSTGSINIISAFTQSTVSITTDSGLSTSMFVYTANNDNSYSSVTLAFS